MTNLEKYSIYIHKCSQTNWLIKVNYPILQNKFSNLLIKTKEKEKKVKQACDVSKNQLHESNLKKIRPA